MAATASIDAIEWLRKQVDETAPDPLKTRHGSSKGILSCLRTLARSAAGRDAPLLKRGRYRSRNRQRFESATALRREQPRRQFALALR